MARRYVELMSVALVLSIASLAWGQAPRLALVPVAGDSAAVGLWHFDDLSGISVADASSQGNTGVVQGNALWNATGVSGGSLNFDGVDDYVTLAQPIELSGRDYTVDFWTKLVSNAVMYPLNISTGSMPEALLVMVSSGRVKVYHNSSTVVETTEQINDGQWHRVTVTRKLSGGLVTIYIDGISKASASGAPDLAAGANATNIGRYIVSANGYYHGDIDEMHISSVLRDMAGDLRFGTTTIGQSKMLQLAVGNAGGGTLSVSGIASSDGQFTASPTNFSVAAGASQNVTITFTPTSAGVKYSTITITSNDATSPTATLMVNGTGTGGPAFFTSLTSWTKYAANPVLNVSSGQFDAGDLYSPMVLNDGMYRVWYVGSPGSGVNTHIGYATSADGVAWTKYGVVLDVGSGWEGQSIHAPSVIKDGGLYKMWYSGHSGIAWHFDIGYATSPDGQTWTKYAGNPVFPGSSVGSSTELYLGTVLKEGTTYKMWYGATSPSLPFHMRYATSSDGITWTDSGQILGAGSPGAWDENLGAYCNVLKKGELYELWYEGIHAGVYAIGYATSADGITWTKSPYNPVLSKGSAGSWEGSHIGDPAVLLEGETHKMWYRGNDGSLTRIGYATSGSATASAVLSFGNVDLGSSGTQTFTVANAGNAALTVSNITLSGTDASQFAISPTSFTINPGGGAQTVTVTLAPGGSPGSRSAILSIAYNAPGGPETVALTGTATGQAAIEVSAPDTVATYNQSLTVPVRVSNTSGSGIVSFELALLYNRRLLSGATVQTAGTLAEGWTIQSNIISRPDSIDTLKIAAAHSTPLSGAGTLLNLNFQVADVRHPAWSQLTLAQVLFNTGTPEGVTDHGSVTLVGVNGTINSMPPAIIPRHGIDVTVNDVDEDRNPGTVQNLGVQVRNGLQTEFLNVTETGASTGIFTGTMATVFSAAASPPPGDGIVQARAGDLIQFCYTDSLPALGGPFGSVLTRCDTTRVVGGKSGLIRITAVSQPGDTVRVRVVDGDLNTDPGVQESRRAGTRNNRTGEIEVVTLMERSASDSVFFGQLLTSLGSSGGVNNDGVINSRKTDSLVVTYVDSLTYEGAIVEVQDQDKIVNPFGDADGNGQVQAYDAARVLFHVLSPFLAGWDSLSANVDSLAPFGRITPYDASLVLQKRVGLIGRFPVQEDESDNHPQPETDLSTPKRVVAQRVLSLAQGEGYWSVMADERDGILSGEVVLSGIEGQVELGPELQEYLISSRSGEGMLRVVFAGAVPVSGPGELLRVYLGVGPGSAQLTRAELNDGQLGVVLSGVEAAAELPTSYALLGNWPNPFNPETTIGFALPERSLVTLAVYDVLGQQVRMLVGRELPAGQHQVRWDGRDELGRPVSSGVYMYRLQAGTFSQLKRMVMIK